jgi:hypothetical protein
MNYVIRNYNKTDYEMICSWWNSADMQAPTPGLIPSESTFLIEVENKPVMSIALFLTNTEMAYLENFIANPEFKSTMRKHVSQLIVNHAIGFAKNLGYKRVCCLSVHDKTSKRYEELGMRQTTENLKSFVKEIA